MRIFNKHVVLVLLLVVVQVAYSQSDSLDKKSPFNFEASYIGDVVSNFTGGIKRGAVYLGLANMKGGFSTDAANWWSGGQFFVNVGNTHGGEPTATLVGDFQGVTNIEAGNLTFMYELWFRQTFNKFDIVVGLQDLNADFAMSKNGALFINSSFGVHSCMSDNVASAIFPLTALGVNVHWNFSDSFLWQAAVFDGTPDDFESNPYNLEWKLNKNQGYLACSEFQLGESLVKGRKGTFKLGVYYHEHFDSVNAEKRNGGLYFIGDQQLTDKLSVFSQVGLSPAKLNKNNRYYSLGMNYSGLFDGRPDDQFGVAIAHAGITDAQVGSETVLEMTYDLKINQHIYLRPDIQYVINPAGVETNPGDALVGLLRFGLKF